MIELAVTVMGLGFVAAQGGAVFSTAWLAKRFLKMESNWWKPLLMLVSYFAWIVLTGFVYSTLGGEWGMMDGGMFMLGLFGTAALSSAGYALVWQALPPIVKRPKNV